jgi:hypothetical protein
VFDDRQAESGAAGGPWAGPVDAVEALEDAVELSGGHPDSVVTDRELDQLAVRLSGDYDR